MFFASSCMMRLVLWMLRRRQNLLPSPQAFIQTAYLTEQAASDLKDVVLSSGE
jgi:hypothetical protein